jgi:hypothetical protein
MKQEKMQCARCRQTVTSQSSYIFAIWIDNGNVVSDTLPFARILEVSGRCVVVHLNGDRLCGKEKAGILRYVGNRLAIADTSGLSVLLER